MTIPLISLILKIFSAIVCILGPAFIWQHFDWLSIDIISDTLFGEFVTISAPFISVLLGMLILLRLLDRSIKTNQPTSKQ